MLLIAVSDVPRLPAWIRAGQVELPVANRCLSRSASTLPTRRPEPIELRDGIRFPFLGCTASGNGAGDTPGGVSRRMPWYGTPAMCAPQHSLMLGHSPTVCPARLLSAHL